MDNKNEEQIEDAEIVENAEEVKVDIQGPEKENAAVSQLNLESLIHRYLKDIEASRQRVKEKKSMLDAAYENDAEYAQAMQKVKEANKVKKGIQQKIQTQPAIKMLADEVNNFKEELKDLQQALSQYLRQYEEKTGSRFFTTEDGEMMEIVIVRKLVRKSDKE